MVTANSANAEKSAISVRRGSKISQMLCIVSPIPYTPGVNQGRHDQTRTWATMATTVKRMKLLMKTL
jgi:hypothetical protein